MTSERHTGGQGERAYPQTGSWRAPEGGLLSTAPTGFQAPAGHAGMFHLPPSPSPQAHLLFQQFVLRDQLLFSEEAPSSLGAPKGCWWR